MWSAIFSWLSTAMDIPGAPVPLLRGGGQGNCFCRPEVGVKICKSNLFCVHLALCVRHQACLKFRQRVATMRIFHLRRQMLAQRGCISSWDLFQRFCQLEGAGGHIKKCRPRVSVRPCLDIRSNLVDSLAHPRWVHLQIV